MKRWMLASSILALTAVGCSGGGGGGVTSPSEVTKSLSISGQLNGSLSAMKNVFGTDFVNTYTAAVFEVRCVTLTGPLVAGSGVVDTADSNKFAVSMAAGINAPVGCWLVRDGMKLADFVFASKESTSGSGTVQQSGFQPKSDSTTVSLGTITISGDSAVVAGVTENGVVAPSTLGDITGTWTLAKVYEDAANGYIHPCDMDDEDDATTAACKANWASMNIFMHMYKFKKTGQEDRLGLALWESRAAFDGCGGKEGQSTGNGWSVDTTFNSDATNVATALPTPTMDLSNLSSTVLAKATFVKSTGDNGTNNCPHGEPDQNGNSTELPGCATAHACSDFQFPATASGSSEKLRCVLNSLRSGGSSGYNWGSSQCGYRLEATVWDEMQNVTLSDMKSDGSGCINSSCGITLPWESQPRWRHFIGQLIVSGTMGTGSVTSTETENTGNRTCKFLRKMALTVTQDSATQITTLIEFSSMRIPNASAADWDETICMGSSWISSTMDKFQRVKLTLRK